MARKINCFVSFSATDGSERDIRFLLGYLDERLEGKINFVIYSEQKSGTDLLTFMRNNASASEAILALFSPDYKHKTDNGVPSGVLTEYMIIVDRLEGRTEGPPLLFIPIYWRGASFEAATPNFFVGRDFVRELRHFQAYGAGGEAYLPDRVAALLRPQIDRIVAELIKRWDEADPAYAELKEKIDSVLIRPTAGRPELPRTGIDRERPEHVVGTVFNPKHERNNMSVEEFSERYFVRTAAFRAIGLHHKMAFTGRKGSGKTTLLKIYKHQNAERYFSPIDIEVNDWNLHYLLEDMTFKPAEGDFSFTAEESKIFDFIWPVFLALCMVHSLCRSTDGMTAHDIIPKREYADQFTRASERYEALFQLAIGIVRDFMSTCIGEASSSSEHEFKADLVRLLNVRACTEHLLGTGYAKLLEVVRLDGRRRFLFCLDRFDTEIQKYRKDLKEHNLSDAERTRRERREVFWIQGLVELIDSLRSPDQYSPNQDFYKLVGPFVDFCVPLPKDRLYEVQLRRRDSIVGEINEEINWQPYELLTMLRKRLQVVWNVDDSSFDKSKTVGSRQRYEAVVEQSGSKMPRSSEIRMNGSVFTLDLFLNVLRHTFFRPRDVIIFYARIVLGMELAQRRGQRLAASALSRIISEQTYKIVEDEFLNEFSDTFKNLHVVLHLFRGSPQILSFSDISELLKDIRFEIYAEDDIVDFGRKVRFLYEIGFIGVCAEGAQLGGINNHDFDFYFFNPRIAQNLERLEVLKAVKFAIHPVFIEYLTLRLNAPTPVLLLNWSRIDELDSYQ